MHVCLVGVEYPKDTTFGGIATYQYLLANELIKTKIKVTVICGTLKDDYDYYENGIHVIRLHILRDKETVQSFENYRKKVADTINEIDKKERIDIIESPEFSGEVVNYQLNRKIPIVIKLHTSYMIWSMLNGISYTKKLHDKVINAEKSVLNNADKIICCSNLLKETMPKYYNISKEQIEVIPNMVDINNFYPLDNNHNSKKIVYCGSLEKRKGIFILAKSIPIVLDKIPDAIFEFIGNSEIIKDNLLTKIPIKYHKNLEFIGFKDNDELNKYYNEAMIGVIPSIFDNFPYVALEELATELPIVANENTGVAEMIKNNKSGILYKKDDYLDLADKIIDLYNNDEKRIRIGKNGRKEILNKFSPEVIIKNMIKMYSEVIYEFRK